MQDLIYIGVTVLFFVLAAALAKGFDRLEREEK